MEQLKFYDLVKKKSFTSSNYRIVTKMVKGNQRRFAVAENDSGNQSWRIMSNK